LFLGFYTPQENLLIKIPLLNSKYTPARSLVFTHIQGKHTCRTIESTNKFPSAVTRCDVFTLKDTWTEKKEKHPERERSASFTISVKSFLMPPVLLILHHTLYRLKKKEMQLEKVLEGQTRQ